MRIEFCGHACMKTTSADGRAVIMDPWFSPEGIFFRSWYPFPDNAHVTEHALKGVAEVLVSHNHLDHFDPPILRRILDAEPSARLHLAKFATSWFRDRAARTLGEPHGGRIVEHAAFEWFDAGGLEFFFVPEESPGQIDSAIVCRDDRGTTLVNLNDARLDTTRLMRIRDEVGEVSVLALQASGASEYPINYTYDADDMRQRKLEKRRLKLEACERVVDLLQPERVLFFAGPPVFLDPALSRHNDASAGSVFPNQLDILRHYEDAAPKLAEMSYFVVPGETLSEEVLYSRVDEDSPRLRPYVDPAYVDEYRARRKQWLGFEAAEPPADEDLLAHFAEMPLLSEYVSSRIDGEITFIIEGATRSSTFTVDFTTRTARSGPSEDAIYVLHAPAAAVAAVLRDENTWDDIMLSLRMTFEERTARFASHFKTLLKYRDARIFELLEAYESRLARAALESDWMAIEHDGCTHQVQRFCPHAGVDLTRHGRLEDDGTITCMAHRFRFDLKTGECVNAKGYRLEVKAPESD